MTQEGSDWGNHRHLGYWQRNHQRGRAEGQSNSRGIPHSDKEQETGNRSQRSRHLPQECSAGQWSWQIVLEASTVGGWRSRLPPSSRLLRSLSGRSAMVSLPLSRLEPGIQARKKDPKATRGVSLFYLKTVLHYHLQRLRQSPSFAKSL